MRTFHVEVVSAERSILSIDAVGLYVTTTVGSLGVLPGHQPMLAGLDSGEAHLELEDGTLRHLAVHSGYLYYSGGDTAVILADMAELAEDIDVPAEERRLASAPDGSDAARRAGVRLRAAAKVA